jgi:hypothetical protein
VNAARGDGDERQSLLTAGDAPQPLAQGFQLGIPAHLLRETRGLQPAGASASAAHVHQPAPAAFVAESLDVVEAAHAGKRSARSGRTSKRLGWSLYEPRAMLPVWRLKIRTESRRAATGRRRKSNIA